MTTNDNGPVLATLETITGNENLLILVANPGDESLLCGGLIAACCQRGRPPFVMVLGDGTLSHPHSGSHPPDQLARLHDRETRAAIACLGLAPGRLLMAGIYDGEIPARGPMFERVVKAVSLVMWARDCNVITAAWPDGCPATDATYRIAGAVAAETGVGLLAIAAETVQVSMRWRLDITGQRAVKQAAVSAHTAMLGQSFLDDGAPRILPPLSTLRQYEVFFRPEH